MLGHDIGGRSALSPRRLFGASGNETRVFCLLPFAFQAVASVRNPKSKIENPKSCVGAHETSRTGLERVDERLLSEQGRE